MKVWRCFPRGGFLGLALTVASVCGPKAADIQPPSIQFLYPTHELILLTNWSSIHGIALDEPGGSGLDRVEISILAPDWRWWSGSNYLSEEVLLPATLSAGTIWACNSGIPQRADLQMGDYILFAYAYDRAGNPGSSSIRVRANVPPPVGVELRPEGLAVIWPKWAEAFGLESSSNMAVPGDWQTVTNQQTVQADKRVVILPISEPSRFFRLKRL